MSANPVWVLGWSQLSSEVVLSPEPTTTILVKNWVFFLKMQLQSGASSRAKHGGAYFSAVSGSIKDPIAVPGWHEVPGV